MRIFCTLKNGVGSDMSTPANYYLFNDLDRCDGADDAGCWKDNVIVTNTDDAKYSVCGVKI